VLFVDDDAFILVAIRRAVVDEDYVPYFTTNAQEALAIMEKTNISVVVTDLHMPTMDGIAMLRIAKEKYPDMQKIVLSGFTQVNQVLESINDGDINKYMTKPWEMGDLLRAVREAINFYNLKKEKERLAKSLERTNDAYKNVFKMMGARLGCVDKDAFSINAIIAFSFSQMKEHHGSKIVIYLCEMLCLTFLNSVPSYPVVFNLQRIKDGICKAMPELTTTGKLTTDIKDVKCHGNADFTLFLFEFLVLLSKQYQMNILDCNITATANSEKVTLKSNLKIDISGNYALSFLTFLIELSNTYDHIFSIVEESEHTVILIEQTYNIQS
jgi:CheY-like chemotaxis protein